MIHNEINKDSPIGKPKFAIHINEGFRCELRQQQLRNAKNEDGTPKYHTSEGISTHQTGMAADIKTMYHSGAELDTVAARVGFRSIGVGKRFIHVDTRGLGQPNEKPRKWFYLY